MQVIALDKALEEALKKPIETLGRQLTAVSAKFVEDYTRAHNGYSNACAP